MKYYVTIILTLSSGAIMISKNFFPLSRSMYEFMNFEGGSWLIWSAGICLPCFFATSCGMLSPGMSILPSAHSFMMMSSMSRIGNFFLMSENFTSPFASMCESTRSSVLFEYIVLGIEQITPSFLRSESRALQDEVDILIPCFFNSS